MKSPMPTPAPPKSQGAQSTTARSTVSTPVPPRDTAADTPAAPAARSTRPPGQGVSVDTPPTDAVAALPCPPTHPPRRRAPQRGLTAALPSLVLRDAIYMQALRLADRFRVLRTLDVAAACFPERPFKAALTAAQRAVRGMVKLGLLRRYKTERFQTVYGLTQHGVEWLDERGHEAAPSVRRVSEMANPEHRLWAQFLAVCAEARGMAALTESELLQRLSREKPQAAQGYLKVAVLRAGQRVQKMLRPDVVAFAPNGRDVSWFEIDRSKRGAERQADLAALLRAMGSKTEDGRMLRLVSVQCKTERIARDAVRIVEQLAAANAQPLVPGRRHFRKLEDGVYAVWAALEKTHPDGRVSLADTCTGHIVIQLLPTWLPKLRISAKTAAHPPGWFEDNALPYKRPATLGPWEAPVSPLVPTLAAATPQAPGP